MISAIIPCYNYGQYIEECISRLEQQSLPPDEIIIVDDASDDETTHTVLKKIEGGKVHVIYSEKIGVSAARNLASRKAKGNYLLIIDSDDYFHPIFIEKAKKVLDSKSEYSAVSCWVQAFGNKKFTLEFKESDTLDFFIKNQSVNACLMKKDAYQIIGGYDESFKHGLEDWEFWIRFSKAGFKLKIIPEHLFFYRQKEHSHNVEAIKRHKSIEREILIKHKDYFFETFPDSYMEIRHRINEKNVKLLNSPTYKLGNAILSPIKKLKSFIR